MLSLTEYVFALINVILGSYQTMTRIVGQALFASGPRLPPATSSTRRGVTSETSMATSELGVSQLHDHMLVGADVLIVAQPNAIALAEGIDIRVTKLLIHPIKSCRGISLSESKYTPEGLQMVLIKTAIEEGETPLLVVSFPQESGLNTFKTQLNCSSETLKHWELISDVQIWKDSGLDAYVAQSFTSTDDSSSPSALLSTYLGREVLLVLKGPNRRVALPTSTHPDLDVAVRFQDGYPILLATTESLTAVQEKVRLSASGEESWKVGGISPQWQTEELVIERFRPNIVVSGSPAPFNEDYWGDVEIGDRNNGGGLPNVDVQTGVRDNAVPFKVITKFRRVEKGATACFGVNAVAEAQGIVRVGDSLRVLTVLERETLVEESSDLE